MYKLICLFFLSLPLWGCQQIWYFNVTDVSDPSHPKFCISRYENCQGKGRSFSVFDIDEVDEEGNLVKTVWSIQPIRNEIITEIQYGTAPNGYKEVKEAIPLDLNKIYRVHGAYFFKMFLSTEKNIVKVKVYNYQEFRKNSTVR